MFKNLNSFFLLKIPHIPLRDTTAKPHSVQTEHFGMIKENCKARIIMKKFLSLHSFMNTKISLHITSKNN